MTAYLMHGNKPCAEVDPEFAIIKTVLNPTEMPVGVWNDNQMIMGTLYRNWLKSRAIPQGRPGMEKIIDKIGKSLADAFIDFHGVSLTDTYWIKDKNSPLTWEDVNFHANGFYPTFGNIYGGAEEILWKPSPDFFTDGVMEKFWMSIEGVPSLIKIDNKFENVLAANEVFVSKLSQMIDLKTKCLSYGFGKIGDTPVCVCPCFVTNEKTDFITALQISHGGMGSNGESFFRQAYAAELEDMLYLDVLVGNIDRHDKNYGILKTGTKESFAPIFDTGSCLGFFGEKEVRLKYPFMDASRLEALRTFHEKKEIPDLKKTMDLLRETYERFQVPEVRFDMARNVITTGIETVKESQREIQMPFFFREMEDKENE